MKRFVSAAVVAGGIVLASGSAGAQSIVRNAGQHESQLEIEPHGVFGFFQYGSGFGAGIRVGIPLINNIGHSFNNSLAISVGGDFIYYPNYYYYDAFHTEGAWGLVPHVMAQFNVYLTGMLSVFAEAGFAPEIYFGCGSYCYGGSSFVPYPAFYLGGRVHFRGGTNFPALTIRIGFPTGLNVGVSF